MLLSRQRRREVGAECASLVREYTRRGETLVCVFALRTRMFGESGESGFFTRRDLARDATEMFLCGFVRVSGGRRGEGSRVLVG